MTTDTVVMRHALEDAEQRELLTRAAPLAASLEYGLNYFEPRDYRDLAYFFLEGKELTEAVETGHFTVQKFVRIARVHEGSLLTVSELSRITNVPQQTLWRWVSKAELPHRSIGNKKLYNINDIKQLLLTRSEGI